MNLNHFRCSVVVALALMIAVSPAAAQTRGLRILIIAGEDAVNIIQQKTAVAPVVEVRDLNDQPVAGAVVKFAIHGGRASFNGARTVSVTTNAAGRAAVTGLTPTSSGAFQITASATFQGQTATVAIAQANVMTAAQAAEAAATAVDAGASGAAGRRRRTLDDRPGRHRRRRCRWRNARGDAGSRLRRRVSPFMKDRSGSTPSRQLPTLGATGSSLSLYVHTLPDW